MKPCTTPNPPARFPIVAGATWHRESGPRDTVTVNGEAVWSVFAASPEHGWAAALVLTEAGHYRLDGNGRYMIRRLHGIVTVKRVH